MPSETPPYDISPTQPLMTNAIEGVSHRTDIGEAKVIKTIFGKAKVRVNPSHKQHSILWLLLALILALVAAGILLEETGMLHQEPTQATTKPVALPEFVPPKSTPEVLTDTPIKPPAAKKAKLKKAIKPPSVAATTKPSLKKALKVRKKVKPVKSNTKGTSTLPLSKPSISQKLPPRKPQPAPTKAVPVQTVPAQTVPAQAVPAQAELTQPTVDLPSASPIDTRQIPTLKLEKSIQPTRSIEPSLEATPANTTPQPTDTVPGQ